MSTDRARKMALTDPHGYLVAPGSPTAIDGWFYYMNSGEWQLLRVTSNDSLKRIAGILCDGVNDTPLIARLPMNREEALRALRERDWRKWNSWRVWENFPYWDAPCFSLGEDVSKRAIVLDFSHETGYVRWMETENDEIKGQKFDPDTSELIGGCLYEIPGRYCTVEEAKTAASRSIYDLLFPASYQPVNPGSPD